MFLFVALCVFCVTLVSHKKGKNSCEMENSIAISPAKVGMEAKGSHKYELKA